MAHNHQGDAVAKHRFQAHRRVLGLRLQKARKAAELTQDDVAEKLGYSQDQITSMERKGRRLDLFEAAELAHLYGVSLEELAAAPTTEEVAEEKARPERRDKA